MSGMGPKVVGVLRPSRLENGGAARPKTAQDPPGFLITGGGGCRMATRLRSVVQAWGLTFESQKMFLSLKLIFFP